MPDADNITYQFEPDSTNTIYIGQFVQQKITITLPEGSIDESVRLKISNTNGIKVFLNPDENDASSYHTSISIDPEDPAVGYAYFFYDALNYNGSYSFDVKYDVPDEDGQSATFPNGGKTFTDTIEQTDYIFTTYVGGGNTPKNMDHVAKYTINVHDRTSSPAEMDIFWGTANKTALFSVGDGYIDDPDKPGEYLKLDPVQMPSQIADPDIVYYKTRTDANGNSTFYYVPQETPAAGMVSVTYDIYQNTNFGNVTVYDPDPYSATPGIGEPVIVGAMYTNNALELDALSDPMSLEPINYNDAQPTDMITFVANGIYADSGTYYEINDAKKILKFPKANIHNDGEQATPDKNAILYIITTESGAVRTSITNSFYATGSTGNNHPDYSVTRYDPAPYIDLGAKYINADNIQGGIKISFQPDYITIKPPSPQDIVVHTAYVNGFVSGTDRPKGNHKVVNTQVLDLNNAVHGYDFTIPATFFQGYDSAKTLGQTGSFEIEYTIYYQASGETLYFNVSSKALDTVGPGD